MVLLYFYEGNDLDDNLRDIRTRYLGHYDPARVRDPEYFRRFIDARTAEACAHCEVADNLVFGRLFSGRTPQAPPIEGSLKPFLATCSMPEATPSAKRAAQICASNELAFIDTRPALRVVAQHELLHGPLDWKHFNRRGYTSFAEAIAREVARLDVRPGS